VSESGGGVGLGAVPGAALRAAPVTPAVRPHIASGAAPSLNGAGLAGLRAEWT